MSVLVTLAVALTKKNQLKEELLVAQFKVQSTLEEKSRQGELRAPIVRKEEAVNVCAHYNPGNGAAHGGQVFPPQLVLSK